MNNSAIFGWIRQANKNTRYPVSRPSRIEWTIARVLHDIRDFYVELRGAGFLLWLHLTPYKQILYLKPFKNLELSGNCMLPNTTRTTQQF